METNPGLPLELRVPRKVAWRLIPFLVLLFLVAFLDRVNLSFAALTMNRDLHLSETAFGFAASVFFLGYMLFEIPSNMLLVRYGARRWIALIAVAWGAAAAAQALISGPLSLNLLRFALGVAEAGFFPGIVFYLTLWFPSTYRARITGTFLLALPLCNVLGAPLSTALLDAHLGGLHGWQWLFLLEGLPSMLLGLAVLWYLDDRPAQAAWLAPEERRWLEQALAADHGSADAHAHELRQALAHPRVWLLGLVYFGVVTGLYAISFWLPQIIKGFGGLGNFQVGLLTTLPYAAAALAMIAWGLHSDASGERCWHVALPAFAAAGGLLASGAFIGLPVLALAALSLAAVGVFAMLGSFWALPTAMLRGAAAAGGIALVNSIGAIGGFAGPLLIGWLKQATGTHTVGLCVLAGLAAMSGIVVLALGEQRAGTTEAAAGAGSPPA